MIEIQRLALTRNKCDADIGLCRGRDKWLGPPWWIVTKTDSFQFLSPPFAAHPRGTEKISPSFTKNVFSFRQSFGQRFVRDPIDLIIQNYAQPLVIHSRKNKLVHASKTQVLSSLTACSSITTASSLSSSILLSLGLY